MHPSARALFHHKRVRVSALAPVFPRTKITYMYNSSSLVPSRFRFRAYVRVSDFVFAVLQNCNTHSSLASRHATCNVPRVLCPFLLCLLSADLLSRIRIVHTGFSSSSSTAYIHFLRTIITGLVHKKSAAVVVVFVLLCPFHSICFVRQSFRRVCRSIVALFPLLALSRSVLLVF